MDPHTGAILEELTVLFIRTEIIIIMQELTPAFDNSSILTSLLISAIMSILAWIFIPLAGISTVLLSIVLVINATSVPSVISHWLKIFI